MIASRIPSHDSPLNLSPDDQRLLIAASLRLLLLRLDCGVAIHVEDLIRIASYVHLDEVVA